MNPAIRENVPTPPLPSADDIRRMLAAELRLPSRIAYTALLLAGLGVASLIGALLLTEPDLPARTRGAFVVMVCVGASWAGYAAWVLARRRVLFAHHRIVASRMALAYSALFTIGCALLARTASPEPWLAGVLLGVVMLIVAGALDARARARFRALAHRRDQLEREIANAGDRS